jgi:hypothetical protein
MGILLYAIGTMPDILKILGIPTLHSIEMIMGVIPYGMTLIDQASENIRMPADVGANTKKGRKGRIGF